MCVSNITKNLKCNCMSMAPPVPVGGLDQVTQAIVLSPNTTCMNCFSLVKVVCMYLLPRSVNYSNSCFFCYLFIQPESKI